MQFIKEFVRKNWDNQTIIRVPVGTEASCTADALDDFCVKTAVPVTKNLDSQLYMTQEEVNEYLGEN